MKITSVEGVAGPAERFRLLLDGEREEEIAGEILLAAGLRVGDEVDESELGELLTQDLHWRAREAALRLLAYRPRSEGEVRTRLRRDGFPAASIEACLDSLRERGFLDDARYAEAFARDRVRLSPRGTRRVVQELRGRGVDSDVAAAAMEGVLREEGIDDLDLAREAARKWRPRAAEEPDRARRRLAGFLARRGFGGDAVRTVVEERCP